MSFPKGLKLPPCTGYDTWPDDFPGEVMVGGVSDGSIGAAAMDNNVRCVSFVPFILSVIQAVLDGVCMCGVWCVCVCVCVCLSVCVR